MHRRYGSSHGQAPMNSERFLADQQTIARELFEEGVYAVGFCFPVVPQGQARIRTQVSAAHEMRHLERAENAFATVGRRHGIVGMGRKEIVERYGL